MEERPMNVMRKAFFFVFMIQFQTLPPEFPATGLLASSVPRTIFPSANYMSCSFRVFLRSGICKKMEDYRGKFRVRKPLLDCSNTVITASSHASTSTFSSNFKPQKSKFSSAIENLDKYDTISCTIGSATRELEVSNPSYALDPENSTSLPIKKSLSTSGADEHQVRGIQSSYSRRKTAGKRQNTGKEVAAPLSCSLALKMENEGNKMNKHGHGRIPKKSMVSTHKKRSRRTTNSLPQDYIEKQRAYFAEIDAFELAEEEVDVLES